MSKSKNIRNECNCVMSCDEMFRLEDEEERRHLNAESQFTLEEQIEMSKEIDLANDEYHLKQLENERFNRLSWEEVYFGIAHLVARRSKDPHTKVGACLVKDGRVIGIGYNGEPRNFSYEFDWDSDEKYDYVVHAEMNAIANACLIGVSCQDADIYLTLSPCSTCMKLLIQHGIRNIYYTNEYKDFSITKRMSECSNVKLIKCEK